MIELARRLGSAAQTISGSGFPHDAQGASEGDLPFVKVSDLALPANQHGIVTASNWVSRAVARALGVRVVPPEAVVFPKVGAALQGNARAITRVPCAIDNNLIAVVPLSGDVRFWRYLLGTIDMGKLAGGGAIPFVSDSTVRDIRLNFPANAEQRRIADFLDDQVSRIDQAVAMRRTQAFGLQAEVLAVAHAEVTGSHFAERSPAKLAWAQTLPSGWLSVQTRVVARMGTGHTPSRSNPEYWVDCDIPWLTTGDVHRFRRDEIDSISDTAIRISAEGLRNSAAVLHKAGTVALSRTASAGFAILMDVDMATSQDFVTWTPGPLVDSNYLLWCVRAMRSDVMGRLAMGSTHKTIYFPDLEAIRIPLPPLDQQTAAVDRICERVATVRNLQQSIARSIELLQERKRALITAAVTGEFDLTTASGMSVG